MLNYLIIFLDDAPQNLNYINKSSIPTQNEFPSSNSSYFNNIHRINTSKYNNVSKL